MLSKCSRVGDNSPKDSTGADSPKAMGHLGAASGCSTAFDSCVPEAFTEFNAFVGDTCGVFGFTTSIAAFVAAFLAADFALGDGDETSAMRALFVPSEDDFKLIELARRVEHVTASLNASDGSSVVDVKALDIIQAHDCDIIVR